MFGALFKVYLYFVEVLRSNFHCFTGIYIDRSQLRFTFTNRHKFLILDLAAYLFDYLVFIVSFDFVHRPKLNTQ